MVTVKTSRALVEALGDEALMAQHLDVESDLNALISLTALVTEHLAAWSVASAPERQRIVLDAPELISRGDLLSDEKVLRASAVASEEIGLARARWAAVRRVLVSLTSA